MNKEERISALGATIQQGAASIATHSNAAKDHIAQLYSSIHAQVIFFELLRTENRNEFTRNLSASLGITPAAAVSMVRLYKFLIGRNVTDRIFLQHMSILPRATSKQAHRKAPPSPLLIFGNLCANVRGFIEKKALTPEEREMIREMLKKLEAEL